jgi:hypothetical protein
LGVTLATEVVLFGKIRLEMRFILRYCPTNARIDTIVLEKIRESA